MTKGLTSCLLLSRGSCSVCSRLSSGQVPSPPIWVPSQTSLYPSGSHPRPWRHLWPGPPPRTRKCLLNEERKAFRCTPPLSHAAAESRSVPEAPSCGKSQHLQGAGRRPGACVVRAVCPDLQRQYSLRTAGPLCLLSCDRAQPGAGSVPSLVLLVIIPVGCTLLTELIFPGAGHRSWSQLSTLSRRVTNPRTAQVPSPSTWGSWRGWAPRPEWCPTPGGDPGVGSQAAHGQLGAA